MIDPLAWNTLDEAAAWLAVETGEKWSARRVLDAALVHPTKDGEPGASNRLTAISAALPPGHVIRTHIVNVGGGRKRIEAMGRAIPEAMRDAPTVPLYSLPWQAVPLLQSDVAQVLAAGWVELGALHERNPMVRGDDEQRINVIEPPARVAIDALGINREHLRQLAERLRPEPRKAEPSTKAPEATLKKWTPERVAEARAMRDRLKAEGARDYAAKTAAHYGVSPARLRELLAGSTEPTKAPAPKSWPEPSRRIVRQR